MLVNSIIIVIFRIRTKYMLAVGYLSGISVRLNKYRNLFSGAVLVLLISISNRAICSLVIMNGFVQTSAMYRQMCLSYK